MHFFLCKKLLVIEKLFLWCILTYLSVKIYLRGYDLIMQLGQARLGPHWTSLIWFFGLKISWHWQISETGILRNKVSLAGHFFSCTSNRSESRRSKTEIRLCKASSLRLIGLNFHSPLWNINIARAMVNPIFLDDAASLGM